MIRLRLCGGLADGQILELRRGLPPDLRVPIWDITERPLSDADPLLQTPLREEIYYLTGSVNSAGEFIYAAGGLSERFRAAILAHEESLHRISGVIEEWAYGLLIERSFGDHSESFLSPDAAKMTGSREYPWDAIAENTKKIIDKIDEVTDDR